MKKLLPVLLATNALLLAALAPAPRAAATTLARMSLSELAGAADAVVRVRCLSSAGQWDRGTIWTFSEFQVLEQLKGAPGERIRVRVPGGRAGHLVEMIEAAPKFRPGEESILFLQGAPGGDYAVTAWAEGTFRIHADSRTGRAAVTQESSGYAVFDPVSRRFRAEGLRDIDLGEFRQLLTAAMATPAAGARR